MKGKFTFLKMSLVGLFLMGGFTSVAQTSYDYYTCSGSTITLNGSLDPDNNPYALYVWTVKDAADQIVGSETITANQSFSYPVPGPGEYTIELQVQDAASCLSDAGTTSLYVLPPFTVDVSSDMAAYCENVTGSTLTAEAIPAQALPAGVSFQYNWDETDENGSVLNANIANTNTYLVDKTTVGSYYFVAKATYVVTNGTLVSDDACETPSDVETIIVNPVPTTPSITITAN